MTRRILAVVPDLDEAGLPPDEWGDFTAVQRRPRCKGIKADGRRCGAFRNERSGFCWQHDPNVTDEMRRVGSMKGAKHNGINKARRLERLLPPRLRPVFDLLERSMQEVVDGMLSPAKASALASLASASVRVLESGELEERMRRIEKAAGGDNALDAGGPGIEEDEDAEWEGDDA